MKLTYISGECAPFAVSGGLGDVLAALPVSIRKEDPSIAVSVILPCYDKIKKDYGKELERIIDIEFELSWRKTGATVYSLKRSGISYYFIENHRYFDRGAMYGEFDDAERFAFFCKAAIEFMIKKKEIPDILHANDWQSALCVIYLKTNYKNNLELSEVRTLYTIHNIEYQGRFSIDILGDVFGISDEHLKHIEFDGQINLMKGALCLSDYVSTVSPNYRDELKHNFFAFGLAPIVNAVSHKMCGIINGLNYDDFSPKWDKDIYFPYNIDNPEVGKYNNKIELQKEIGLPISPKTPLIVMISRLTATKGIDLVLHIIEELLSKNNVQFAVLGTGEQEYQNELIKLSYKYENLISIIKFDRALSKKIYAAADIFLMPSKSEPCGLAQMIACSYGCVPIVRSVGGLCDTIQAWDGEEGNGFRFDNYNAHELLYTIKNALALYDSDQWRKIQKNAMSSKFDWSDSAKKYISIYNNLLNW